MTGGYTLILGDNPIFGVNHLSRETGDGSAGRFQNPKAVIRLFHEVREAGASGVMLSSHERAAGILDLVRKDQVLSREFEIYPNLPYLLKYVSQATQKGTLPMIRQTLLRPGAGLWGIAAGAGGFWALVSGRSRKLLEAGLDIEFLPYRGTRVRTVFLHNGIVDLALGLGLVETLGAFDRWAKRRGFEPGYGTLNFELLARTLDQAGMRGRAIMAPFNALGFHMNPSREANEKALQKTSAVPYAMNVLASGAIPPAEALAYIKRLPRVRHVLIGTSRPSNFLDCSNHLQST